MNWTEETLRSTLAQPDFTSVYEQADVLRRERKGEEIQIRALLEFSNYCKRQCRYCGLNAKNARLTRFRLEPAEIVETALAAAETGYHTIVLQSGEDGWFTPEIIGEIVQTIKPSGMAVTLSCGEHPEEVYRYWKECGADRYLLKHETADPDLYRQLHPDAWLKDRVSCQKNLKRLGYETGGGFMVGLPGQTLDTLAQDLLLLREVGCDMAGIGPFLPNPDTSLGSYPHGSAEMTRRAVALARLLLPDANLPATTALGVLEPEAKRSVFSCGANVVMQKVTPNRVKRFYEIYPSELKDNDISSGREQIEEEILRLGRVPV